MQIEELIALLHQDPVALFFYFLLLPFMALLLNIISGPSPASSAYGYMYSLLVYGTAIPALISGVFWLYSIMMNQKNLLELSFSVYYLPLISAVIVFMILRKKGLKMKALPWFGELYELLITAALALGLLLLLMHKMVLPFQKLWQIGLSFFLFFLVFKFLWEYGQQVFRSSVR
ncbi:hypothetical protein [Saprospira grandis]|uniref:hypothetical protein n=1 Tax=Saprospira grandis TaxID=1008 RepID=UPI0022DD1E71|nr:hypothetical protein [Saprospira grandis]WBM75444.1 hypothetical protein OP864_04195 [Saprospira grandis]